MCLCGAEGRHVRSRTMVNIHDVCAALEGATLDSPPDALKDPDLVYEHPAISTGGHSWGSSVGGAKGFVGLP